MDVRIRLSLSISQQDFAKILNVSQTYLSQLENNRKEPSVALLNHTASVIHKPVVYIIALATEEKDLRSDLVGSYELLQKLIKSIGVYNDK